MADLNQPNARLLLARLAVEMEEQLLSIDQKELRLDEAAEEEARIRADLEGALEPKLVELETAERSASKKGASTPEARRARIDTRKQRLLIRNKELRLLELDVERTGLHGDIEAARRHIAKVEAEASQQRARLTEETGNG